MDRSEIPTRPGQNDKLTRDMNGAVLDVGFAGGLDAAAQSARVTTERPDVIVVSGSLEFLAAGNHFWIAQLY